MREWEAISTPPPPHLLFLDHEYPCSSQKSDRLFTLKNCTCNFRTSQCPQGLMVRKLPVPSPAAAKDVLCSYKPKL